MKNPTDVINAYSLSVTIRISLLTRPQKLSKLHSSAETAYMMLVLKAITWSNSSILLLVKNYSSVACVLILFQRNVVLLDINSYILVRSPSNVVVALLPVTGKLI